MQGQTQRSVDRADPVSEVPHLYFEIRTSAYVPVQAIHDLVVFARNHDIAFKASILSAVKDGHSIFDHIRKQFFPDTVGKRL